MALARAVMRNGPILICDEPTAPLDPESEYEVLSRLDELGRGRMSVIVSHRLSTAVGADRIVVLDKGRVAEQGRHPELLRSDGVYARLFRLQAARYIDGGVGKGRVTTRRNVVHEHSVEGRP